MTVRAGLPAAVLLAAAGAPLAAQTVAEIQVAPPSISIKVGERYGLLATAYDRGGNVLPAARVTPASRHRSTMRVASCAWVLPQAWKNSPLPPKVPQPKVRTGTFRPERPNRR